MRLYQAAVVVVMVVALSEGADAQPRCGRVAGNVEGQDILPGRWPWFVHLYLQQNLHCSGSLISDQWVLTAAWCLEGVHQSDVTIVLGRTNQTGSNPNKVSRRINQTVFHPLFNEDTFDNNICLVKLSSPVELSDHISPVCLAAESSTFPNGTFSWIVGPLSDGNNELTELQLQILGNNECRNRSTETINVDKICTRDDPSKEQPCLDAEGAPLLIRNDDLVWIQLGISVIREICRKTPSPPVYTRVSSYQEWISNVTGSGQPGFVTFHSSGDDGGYTSTRSPPRPNTTLPVVPPKLCKTPPVVPPRTTCDRSIFGRSEKLSSTFFICVFALLFSLILVV